jgi:hypothetical protein
MRCRLALMACAAIDPKPTLFAIRWQIVPCTSPILTVANI